MVKDIIKYNNREYQLSTVYIENTATFETMIFLIENGAISGQEVYCFRTLEPGQSIDKHADIYHHPEKYLSEEAIAEYLKSKEENLVNNKIYIVNGYINESGDESTWIEELFTDKEQASACCIYLNMTKTQKNVMFDTSEISGFCNEDYISKLRAIKKVKE